MRHIVHRVADSVEGAAKVLGLKLTNSRWLWLQLIGDKLESFGYRHVDAFVRERIIASMSRDGMVGVSATDAALARVKECRTDEV